MQATADHRRYCRSADQDRRDAAHPVVIIGAGPVGLALALDLARKGHRSVVLERRTGLSEGSRAICWSKRTLEIMARLGVAEALAAKGVTWQRGKLFHRDREVFQFDLLPEAGHRWPAFVNLQQFHFEVICETACLETGLVDIRWGHEVEAVEARPDAALLRVGTPEGAYTVAADWLVACDGARSVARQQLGLGFVGQSFDDQFLICDIEMKIERPTERWFWFDPSFNPGRSALLHRQADDIWRLDFQIGADADRAEETKPENVARRVRAMLGDIDFSFAWISCYRFHCRRVERFRHGRVLLAGDAAHQVSPFGARGGNSGVQDADNLAWKLDLVLRRLAPEVLLDSYDSERRQAADENILASTRSTDFIRPKSVGAAHLRDAVLDLAGNEPFARRLINSGRLSLPTTYDTSPLSTADSFSSSVAQQVRPGAAAIDAPTTDGGWLLDGLGDGFTLLDVQPHAANATDPGEQPDFLFDGIPIARRTTASPEAASRWGAETAPAVYLIRPDRHIAARWRAHDAASIGAALARAVGES
jgi:3-(3-hydroxy-phenyl)propionate hydroxylase